MPVSGERARTAHPESGGELGVLGPQSAFLCCRQSPAVFVAGTWVPLLHHTCLCFVLFCFVLQQTKERVKLLIQLADGFCDKGHAHAAEIKKCVTAVDRRYQDFSLRMEKHRTALEKALGIPSDSSKSVKRAPHTSPSSAPGPRAHSAEPRRLSPRTE